MAGANPSTKVELTFDESDDLLYFARTDSLEDLETTITELTQKYTCSAAQILSACVDAETHNTVWHFASANGLINLLRRMLDLLSSSSSSSLPPPSSGNQAASAGTVAEEVKAQINRRNKEGNTPLHWASYNGHLEVVKMLLRFGGADMWIKNFAGHLALFEAERAEKTDVVQFLLEAGGTEVERTGRVGAVTREDLEDVDAEASSSSAAAVNGDTDGGVRVDVTMEDGGPSG